MTDVSGTLELIQEFVDFAISQRKKSLSADSKHRMEMLDETLRDLIDGAKLKPRRIAGAPATDDLVLQPKPTPAPAPSPPPAKGPAASKGGTLDALSKVLEMSLEDKKKVREVSVDQLPKSNYTSSTRNSFLAGYYAEDIVPLDTDSAKKLVPKRVIAQMSNEVEGEKIDLTEEARALFGLSVPQRSRAAVPKDPTDIMSSSTPVSERGPVPIVQPAVEVRGRPTIVHLIQGGVRRGRVEDFDPLTGAVTFTEDGSTIVLTDVLAIFFGLEKGEVPGEAAGEKVVVKLINDKQVAGLTNDYQEGGDALTVTPEQKRGNVDRIWIPAWAVKEIQLG